MQPATVRGARVIGTARPESHAFLSGLGATPVPYRPGLAERVRVLGGARIDFALDIAGAGSPAEFMAITGDARLWSPLPTSRDPLAECASRAASTVENRTDATDLRNRCRRRETSAESSSDRRR